MEKRLHYNDEFLHTVLIVDDELINREILGAMLEDAYNLIFAQNGEEALELMMDASNNISIVLLDLMMPKLNGFDVIRITRDNPALKRIPIIVLTSEKSAEAKSIDMGAVDFIPKPYDAPEIIKTRVKRMIELSDDRMIIQSTERDKLTGLFSKNFFFEYCEIMENYHPERQMDAIVINIDHFHLMNEIYGKEFRDNLLYEIALIIKKYSNENEGIAGRGEHDTFYMYLNHQENYEILKDILNDKLSNEFESNHIHVRIGINTKTESNPDIPSLFAMASLASDTIRGDYSNYIALFDQNLKNKSYFQERLIHDIHNAVNNKQFIPYFQPKYDISGNTPVLRGCEALIRWKHPELGMISPGEFITLFESNGLIQIVDLFIWEEVFMQASEWKRDYNFSIPISINVSRIDFYIPNFADMLTGLVDKYGLKHSDIHLEITESAYSEDTMRIISVIDTLRSRGFEIEMDDFGTGYSSLGVLSSIPIDVLKIDMKFIKKMHDNEKDMRLVEIIMDIAKMLGVPVISEGVENEAQYDSLKKLGCDMIQGFYFSKPLPAEKFSELFRQEQKKNAVS